MTGQRPIGWWVKRLDALLEQVVDRTVAADGLTRRHWQVLHAVGSSGLEERDLLDALALFGAAAEVDAVIADLTARGWLARTGSGCVAHTAAGRAAHQRLLERITQVRLRVTDGLTAEEYDRTVAALARMADNVERELAVEEG
jgi:DNA-binding MarR family transcriptional regulator